MEEFRDRELERLASGVADERHVQAESRATESGYLQSVHARMKRLNRTTFKAHGVEFLRVPGDEKLRVRLTRGGGEEQGEDLQEERPEPDFDTDEGGAPVDTNVAGDDQGIHGAAD